ncbi:hypothetical protein ACIG5E_07380 [Kitasatospora sp. NPDC053057]|uniref:hypothetical protein n=1 Tax=Kitasatospora sp. NPDC053057 TaxID=3364062 RepID=UPI0037C86B45
MRNNTTATVATRGCSTSGADPREDLDLASYGIVKVHEGRPGSTFPGLPWDPKEAFAAVGEYYRTH